MDKFKFTKSGMFRNDDGHYYAVTDVDTRIAEMRANFDAAADLHAKVVADKNASIAELERKKGLLWQRLHDLDEQLLDALGHWRGTKSHELIVDLLTDCRTS